MPTATAGKQALPLLLAGMVFISKREKGAVMALPEKEILRLYELVSRWGKDIEYVKHLIITKRLPVWGYFDDIYKTFDTIPSFGEGDEEMLLPMGVKPIKGYFKLEGLEQTSANHFYFTHIYFFSKEDQYQLRAGGDDELNCTSRNLEDWALFRLEDILEIENNKKPTQINFDSEKPLHPREKNNLLKVIAALCAEQGLNLDTPYKAATVIENQVKNLGLTLKEDKIADILKSVSELTKTAKKPN